MLVRTADKGLGFRVYFSKAEEETSLFSLFARRTRVEGLGFSLVKQRKRPACSHGGQGSKIRVHGTAP